VARADWVQRCDWAIVLLWLPVVQEVKSGLQDAVVRVELMVGEPGGRGGMEGRERKTKKILLGVVEFDATLTDG